MPKLLALITFSHSLASSASGEADTKGNAKFDLTTVTIERGEEFDADEEFATECISRGQAVNALGADADFLRSVKSLIR